MAGFADAVTALNTATAQDTTDTAAVTADQTKLATDQAAVGTDATAVTAANAGIVTSLNGLTPAGIGLVANPAGGFDVYLVSTSDPRGFQVYPGVVPAT